MERARRKGGLGQKKGAAYFRAAVDFLRINSAAAGLVLGRFQVKFLQRFFYLPV